MSGSWSMAVRNLSRNKRRNLATGLAIALGFAALLALGGYIYRVQNYLRVYTIYSTRTGHVTIYKHEGLEKYSVKPKNYSLTEDDQKMIAEVLASVSNVEMSAAQLVGMGLVGNGCRTLPFIATGIDPGVDRMLRQHPEVARWGRDTKLYAKGKAISEYPPELGAVALAEGLSRLLHKSKVHDEFPATGSQIVVVDCAAPNAKELISADANVQMAAGAWSGMMSALDGEVVAIYNTGVTETNNAAILTSLTHLQKLYDTPNATFYSIWLKNPRKLHETMDEIRTKLGATAGGLDIYPWDNEDMSPFYTGTMQFLYTMIGFISVVLATVIVFSVFNAATMTVIERSQEIGMMRSLGFTRTRIRRLFVQEMLVLAVMSIVFGGIVGGVGIFGVNRAQIPINPPGVAGGMALVLEPNARIVAGAALLIFLLSILTTLVAVRSIVKRKIAVLLMGTQR